jgi:hypothetical protein
MQDSYKFEYYNGDMCYAAKETLVDRGIEPTWSQIAVSRIPIHCVGTVPQSSGCSSTNRTIVQSRIFSSRTSTFSIKYADVAEPMVRSRTSSLSNHIKRKHSHGKHNKVIRGNVREVVYDEEDNYYNLDEEDYDYPVNDNYCNMDEEDNYYNRYEDGEYYMYQDSSDYDEFDY